MSSETVTETKPSANLHLSVSRETTRAEHDQPVKERDVGSQPFSNGFFDDDPITSKARAEYFKVIIPGTLFITAIIWTVLAIYWGALWKTPELIHHLNGWVVDFDGGELGSSVSQYLAAIHDKEAVTWHVKSAALFPNGPIDLAHAVVEEQCWVAVAINPGATNSLTQAVDSANATYNASLAVTIFGNEARNENGFRTLIIPNVNTPLQQIAQQVAIEHAQQLATQSNLQTLLSQAPSVVTRPLWYTIDNLRPFDVPVAAAVDFVGLIYLLIISFIVANQHIVARAGLQRRLKLKSLLILRLAAPIITYFWLSLMYSMLSLAFGVPFSRKFGHSGFLIYWMMSWCGMMALGLALEAMFTLLTLRFIPFFLVLWIISELLQRFNIV
jgi:hypothetical protein